MTEDDLVRKDLVLVVCPLCQREGHGNGVIAKVDEMSMGGYLPVVFVSSYQLQTSDFEQGVAVRLDDGSWHPALDRARTIYRVKVGCRHGRRRIETADLDAELARVKRRPRILVLPPDKR
jgi:hypothetical protein